MKNKAFKKVLTGVLATVLPQDFLQDARHRQHLLWKISRITAEAVR